VVIYFSNRRVQIIKLLDYYFSIKYGVETDRFDGLPLHRIIQLIPVYYFKNPPF